MVYKSKTVFNGSDVPFFCVPHHLVGLIGVLSVSALRLYLFILAKAGRNQRPIVRITNEQLHLASIVDRNNVLKARNELMKLKLATVTKKKGHFLFELLNPSFG